MPGAAPRAHVAVGLHGGPGEAMPNQASRVLWISFTVSTRRQRWFKWCACGTRHVWAAFAGPVRVHLVKLLFLDFDGVLNSERFFRAQGNRYLPEQLDEGAVARLNAILARTGAKVIVSSTWRLGYSMEQLQVILARHGFSGEVVGVTPRLEDVDEDGIRVPLHVPRGREIQTWLDTQTETPRSFRDPRRRRGHGAPR